MAGSAILGSGWLEHLTTLGTDFLTLSVEPLNLVSSFSRFPFTGNLCHHDRRPMIE